MKSLRQTDHRNRWPDEEENAHPHLEDDLRALNALLRPYQLVFSDDACRKILAFARDLLQWNDRLNLLSRPDAPNVIRKHVAASVGVLLLVHPNPGDRWVDVGTGAGFPGLVLKILHPELNVTLVDSARKRCLFVENVIRSQGLGKVPVLQMRAETLVARGESLASFAVLTARAVASLEESLRLFGPLVAPEGRLVTFKGPQWQEDLKSVRERGVLEETGFQLETATRIPWTQGHILSMRKRIA